MDTTFNHISRSGISKLRAGDVYDVACPSRSVIQMLADKWTMLVIDSLSRGPMRFGELRRQVGGVTQKMLTQTLRLLERDGLVLREVYPSAPPSVEYSLTPLGVSITAITEQMCLWAQDNMKPVLVARLDYDKRAEREYQPLPSAAKRRNERH
ncbi:winged helix-turn-helix transcriptional regulator [Pseudomonas sp. NPDC088368]|uniref:winged helix-turn-helix transcriptional regulator n=1 Tax=Pseudomonas sp. NPDC088368 TaxID=3364453 RepID=UPI0038181524